MRRSLQYISDAIEAHSLRRHVSNGSGNDFPDLCRRIVKELVHQDLELGTTTLQIVDLIPVHVFEGGSRRWSRSAKLQARKSRDLSSACPSSFGARGGQRIRENGTGR